MCRDSRMEGEQSANETEINTTLMSVIAFIKQPYIGKDGRSYLSCVFVFMCLCECFSPYLHAL